ncbi:MAG: hypothetical protein RLY31_1737 [Bacteroidota bacterium]|jgi:tellurite resistance protein TerC
MLIWSGFVLLVLLLLLLDLGVFNRKPHEIGTREAFGWTGLWVSISLLFGFFVYFGYTHRWLGLGDTIGHPQSGAEAAMAFLAGYIMEESLSMDNIFIMAVIFNYFRIPLVYQHRVLFWGILGALVFRGAMIGMGAYLVERFDFILYVFGGILIWTAYKMVASGGDNTVRPDDNATVRLLRKIVPVTRQIKGERFFVRHKGRIIAATPMFVALIVIETTDIMFAFDSIPAIFAVTTDPFLVFTSNIFAILGLRSMYFVLASVLDKFRYLQYALALVLGLVGLKMLVLHPLEIQLPAWLSLLVIVVVLGAGILLSLLRDRQVGREKA